MASSGGGMEDMSRDDLLEIIDELNKDLEERESHIQDLEKENIRLSRGKKGKRKGDDDGSDAEDAMARAAADVELERLRDKYDMEKIENSKLNDKINELTSFLKAVEAEKLELEADVRRLRQKADDLETAMATMQESTAQSLRRSQDITKAQKDVQKQQLQALQENEKLQQEKIELQKKLDTSEQRRIQIEEFIVKIADEKDTLESDKLAAEAARDELSKRVAELDALLDESEVKYQSTLTSEGQWEAQVAVLRAEILAAADRNQAEIARYKEEAADLNQQLVSMKDTTSIGSKQREIESLKEDLKNNFELLEEMHRALETSEADKEQLAKKLVELDTNFETKLYDKVSSEREHNRVLQKRMAGMKTRLDETEARSGAFEKEIARLQREIDELNNWKVVYENGHGFQELARHQMKLKEDNRRLSLAIEELTQKVGESMDANAVLSQAFEKLKAEAGYDPDFHYPELVLKEDMQSENARLQSQVHELDEQVMALENDCIRLRKALKNQAGTIGEQGFKYQGMTADMLVKVNEFAMSLRDGTVQLPMDNRSSELLQENRNLKSEISLLNAKVEKYEREIASGGVGASRSNALSANPTDAGLETELRAMRQDLQLLLSENSDLKQRQRRMQDEVLVLLSKQGSAPGEAGHSLVSSDVSGNIENMLIASNEILMKELQELRKIATAKNEELTPRDARLPPTGRLPPSKQKSRGGDTPVRQAESPESRFAPATPMSNTTSRFNATTGGPTTPHGKQLLNKTLTNMRLPPEEWADEVRDLSAQLVECVEQLYEREAELNDTKDIISNLEETLVNIKQQTTIMYFDFAEKSSQWEAKEKQLISEANAIAAERDGVKLKLKRVEETIDLMQREDPSELEAKLREYSKKIAILEVNESVLSRRYTSISEQLSEEQATRRNIETDFAEMEGTLKRRIVQLEDYKAKAGRQLGFLQTMLDSSVPRSDYFCIQTELESLREDHLKALSRELDSRVAILKAEDELRDLAACKLKITFLDAELTAANAGRRDLVAQLEHQKEATRKAINALSSSGGSATEMGLLVSEMAKFRGEASRLEVELVAANRRNELLRDQLGDANRVIEELKSNSKQLSSQISQLESAEQAIRHECRDLRMKFEGGLTRKEAEDVQNKLKLFSQEQEELRAEVKKQTELAEIAAQQAQSLASFRDTYLDELKELRAHCMNLESRTDDDLLIGKLQRSLMSTKASYRAFAQKYQMVRSNLRQNEIALRVVETKLNEREEVVVQMHTNYRTELNALKTAIRSLWNMSDGDNSPFNEDSLKALSSVVPLPLGSNISLNSANFFDGFVPFGFRLQKFSDKISELASKASDYKTRAEVAERNCNEKEAILDDVSAERDILIKKCDDLVLVLSTSSANDTKQQQSVKAVAQRVSSLTEELKQLKLSNLQLKREVSTMKSEKKHLQTMLSNFEESVRALEKSKVTDETKQVVMDLMKQQSQSEPTGDDIIKKLQREAEVSKVLVEDNAPATDFPGRAGERLIIDNEEYLRNLEDAKNKYRDSQAELASLKSKLDAYQGRLVEAQNIIAEKDEQLNYCERVMVKEGLPSFKTGFSSVPRSDLRQSNMQKINPDQLQEAASNTIGSLKKLLAEKNETIEKYLAKIASLQEQLNDVGGGKRVSLADRRAEELLRKLQSEDERSSGDPSPRMARDVPVPDGVSEKFLRQIEEAEDLIKEKNRTISQLEQKLGVQENQRERAEMRCAAALQEMEAMKNDIILIAQQLQASEEKVAKLQQQALNAPDMSRPNVDLSASFTEAAKASKRPVQSVDPAKVNELKKAIKAKDEKLKSYRTIILRLKDEFIKAEEERAIREAGKTSDKKKGTNANDSSMIGNSAVNHELDELRSQVSALRDGLKQAKEDLDQARKGREKLVKAKQTAEEEAEKFEAQIARAEAQAAAAQEALQRCRKDLEDSRRKEVRLRDKLREMLAAQHVEDEDEEEADEHKADDTGSKRPQTAGGASSQTKSGQKIQALQREIDTLRVQNEALRKQNGATEGEPVVTSGAPDGLMVAAEKSTKEELRQQLHAKWESEKRLQKRVTVLEKRLQDKVQECDDAQAQLRKAKESLSSLSNSATAARERERKEREEKTRAASRAVPGGDLAQLEQANNRVFELENEVTALRRQVEVDHPSELNALRFQCDNLRARVGDLESQLKLVQERRRRTGAPSLREEEEMYLREERLRDDLEALRRQKQELESLLLDKDARIMTLSFDIDANAGELSRCRRRIRELETYCRELASKPGVPSGIKSAWAEADGAPGANRGKREKELEGAVEALKGVVEKLKQENDRLRRGIGAGGAETNRAKVEADRRKIEKLEEELEELRGKSTKQEDLSQKLVQKTQQIASLRKALKSKEDECNEANRRASDFEAERESLRQQLAEAKANIQKLDSHVASRITAQREAGANVGSAASEIAEWKRKANEAAVTIEDLKQKLVEARRENSSNRRGDFSSNAGLQSSAKEVEYQETIAKLKKENERLRQELSEFDLEFFEEIEDLKFAHAEAVKKLKQYELMDSRR